MWSPSRSDCGRSKPWRRFAATAYLVLILQGGTWGCSIWGQWDAYRFDGEVDAGRLGPPDATAVDALVDAPQRGPEGSPSWQGWPARAEQPVTPKACLGALAAGELWGARYWPADDLDPPTPGCDVGADLRGEQLTTFDWVSVDMEHCALEATESGTNSSLIIQASYVSPDRLVGQYTRRLQAWPGCGALTLHRSARFELIGTETGP